MEANHVDWRFALEANPVKVPRIFNLPTAVLERRDGVWQSMDSAEKAHVLVIYKNKIAAAESMRTRFIELLGEKLKDDPAKARGTLEQRRAVVIFAAIPPWGSKLREQCLREKMKHFYPEERDPMSMISIVTDTAGGERPCS
ncbi:hypothetical protein MKW98_000176 [Papaver atlanticum]|uniref:Uncharacterized protein n=1 Tax=Papaver atlanticum TaxID=357466 RepID=A0AAD4XKF0_9MAGN|nr:hypothetical protein MKW98_000176 [Papaver atlanticum]